MTTIETFQPRVRQNPLIRLFQFFGELGLTKTIDLITYVLMFVSLAIPFTISFGALMDLARQHHIAYPVLYPILVDGGFLIFKLQVLRSTLYDEKNPFAWFMTALLFVISCILNAAHVGLGASLLTYAMAILPTMLMFCAFITLTNLVKSKVGSVQQLATEKLNDLRKKFDELMKHYTEMRKVNETLSFELEQAQHDLQQVTSSSSNHYDELQKAYDELDRLKEVSTKFKEVKALNKQLTKQVQVLNQFGQDEINLWLELIPRMSPRIQAGVMYGLGMITADQAIEIGGHSLSTLKRDKDWMVKELD